MEVLCRLSYSGLRQDSGNVADKPPVSRIRRASLARELNRCRETVHKRTSELSGTDLDMIGGRADGVVG